MSYSPKHDSPDKKKKQKILVISLLAVFAVIIVISLIFIIRGATDNTPQTYGTRHDVQILPGGGENVSEVTGTWTSDNVTVMTFDGEGRGTMHTAVDDYQFAYSAQDGKLAIDFDFDGSDDTEFTYSVNGDTLDMKRGTQEYHLKKQ